jgi:hypothetical protein
MEMEAEGEVGVLMETRVEAVGVGEGEGMGMVIPRPEEAVAVAVAGTEMNSGLNRNVAQGLVRTVSFGKRGRTLCFSFLRQSVLGCAACVCMSAVQLTVMGLFMASTTGRTR